MATDCPRGMHNGPTEVCECWNEAAFNKQYLNEPTNPPQPERGTYSDDDTDPQSERAEWEQAFDRLTAAMRNIEPVYRKGWTVVGTRDAHAAIKEARAAVQQALDAAKRRRKPPSVFCSNCGNVIPLAAEKRAVITCCTCPIRDGRQFHEPDCDQYTRSV